MWEYKVDNYELDCSRENLELGLNQAGRDRWELVNFYENIDVRTYIFRRQIELRPEPFDISSRYPNITVTQVINPNAPVFYPPEPFYQPSQQVRYELTHEQLNQLRATADD